MKFRKLTVLLAISSIMALAMVGCGSTKKETDVSDKGAEVESTDVVSDKFPTKITAEKINSVDVDSVTMTSGGMLYKENGKYGILSFDGKKDTGAKYVYCSEKNNYFVVADSEITSVENVEDLNSRGLINAEGKEIIPKVYASIDVLNERYAKVIEVTEMTTSEEDAILYYTGQMFSFSPAEGDTLFKGVWYVYDITTGEKVEGATGTKAYNVSASGNYISFTTDERESVRMNQDGKRLDASARLFENGAYMVTDGNKKVVYDTDDNKIFTCEAGGFVPSSYSKGYYIAAQYGDTTKYAVMDLKGNIVSAEFEKNPIVVGKFVLVDDKVCDFDGNQVIDGTYEYLYQEKQMKQSWAAKNDEEVVYFKEDGTILYRAEDNDNMVIDTIYFLTKDKESKKYYSLKDKDYTIEGYGIAPWLVKVDAANYTYNIVDAISGNTIIEGYAGYTYGYDAEDHMYLYAKKADGGIDIYKIK